MLTILTTTNHKQAVTELITSVERLDELVTIVTDTNDIDGSSKVLIVENAAIKPTLDWHDTEPPYVLPTFDFSSTNFLALVFYKLGNHQKAFEFVNEEDVIYNHLLIGSNLQFGYEISDDLYAFAQLNSSHNVCIIQHYGHYLERGNFNELKELYKKAIETAENDELKIYTVKHFCNLLLDNNAFDEAEDLVRSQMERAISEEAKNALNVQLASALMAKIVIPYDMNMLEEVQELQLQSIAFYEERNLKVNAGLVLIDASEIANFKNNFIASKDFINKAILYFKAEDIKEFLGEAGLRKATLLYTWSKGGSPQYYKPAINAFQDTLKVFKRDSHPQKFADIHHNIALIYSEIPVSSEEKPMWTAFCASSFKEALKFYTKEEYPYEYAMISHNYATALMNFPEAKLHNNFDKAFDFFQDALAIRTAKDYPFERALSLLNQLELYWLMHNENSEAELKTYEVMLQKTKEVKELVSDSELHEKADFHIKELENLKSILN